MFLCSKYKKKIIIIYTSLVVSYICIKELFFFQDTIPASINKIKKISYDSIHAKYTINIAYQFIHVTRMLRVTLSGCQVSTYCIRTPRSKQISTNSPLQRLHSNYSYLCRHTHFKYFENVRKLCVTRSQGIILQRTAPLSTHTGTFLEKIHDGSFT